MQVREVHVSETVIRIYRARVQALKLGLFGQLVFRCRSEPYPLVSIP